MGKKEYKVGDKLKFVGGNKIQITSVNPDGTANFSEINPATKKPYPFSQGLHGKLPSLKQQAVENIKLTSELDSDETENEDYVSLESYDSHAESAGLNVDLTDNMSNKYNFPTFASFKQFITDNAGKAQLKLVEALPIIIRGNLGDTVVEHKFLGKTRTVTKVNSRGFDLEGSFMDWGKSSEWVFKNDTLTWTGSDGYRLVYQIVAP